MSKLILSFSLLVLLTACGITGHRPNDPGYADYTLPGWTEVDRVMTISFGPAIIGMAKWAVDKGEEPELEALLDEIRAIRIAIYEVEGDTARLQQRVSDTTKNLLEQGWEVLVRVHDDEEGETEDVLVMSRFIEDRITGFVVLALDDEEMVFVNLMGNIDPAQLGDILHALDDDTDADLDIDLPEDLGENNNKEAI